MNLALSELSRCMDFLTDDSRTVPHGSQNDRSKSCHRAVVQVLKHISGRESPAAATNQRGAIHLFRASPFTSTYQPNTIHSLPAHGDNGRVAYRSV